MDTRKKYIETWNRAERYSLLLRECQHHFVMTGRIPDDILGRITAEIEQEEPGYTAFMSEFSRK